MMFLFDRIYGEIQLPPLLKKALECPGLLRLREVRMANVPFLSFPSFSAVTRFEHSLGVCHLAGLFARSASLSEKDTLELMFAALYHDVATPPFAHAVEEVLSQLFGFDHEEKLRELIIGKSQDVGGHRTQLFLGRSLKLHSICQSSDGRKIGLDPMRIADLAAGTTSDPLGDVVSSKGVDLDNIDNVLRAATAMGINDWDPRIAESLARSLIYDGKSVRVDESAIGHIMYWKSARATLYGMIFADIQDFALQTMMKQAVSLLAKSKKSICLRPTDWCLTDNELVHERLLNFEPAAKIVKRARLGDMYECLAFLYLSGGGVEHKLTEVLTVAENIAVQTYKDFLQRKFGSIHAKAKEPQIAVNFYLDKRDRKLDRRVVFFGRERNFEESTKTIQVLLGVFTPDHLKWDNIALESFTKELQLRFTGIAIGYAHVVRKKYPDVLMEELI
jgi:hypothetical protein